MSHITLDYNYAMSEFIGSHGFGAKDFEAMTEKATAAHISMERKRAAGNMAWQELPFNQKTIVTEIKAYAEEVRADVDIDTFVLLGIGGSALGPLAVQQALNHPFYNELPRERRNGPKFYVADNVDPERLAYLFDVADPHRSLYCVISKSGGTSETMSQFMIIKELLEKELGKEIARRRIVCVTDEKKGNLIKIARDEGYKTFYIPEGVGGRFTELCPVGLLPAAICGVDIDGLLAGAAAMDKLCRLGNLSENPAYMYAALHFLAQNRGKNISVMMPYADGLKYMADWYAQLWAESLGKRLNNNGEEVFVGQTPVKSLGATDQHSQVQLYAEGPYDKIVVFLAVEEYRETVTIPRIFRDIPDLGFLGGVTHNRLIEAERSATEYALCAAGRPSMTITLPVADAYYVGQLIYMMEVATAFAGELLNINAFDQPGVEEGKNATYAIFGKPGYEAKKHELDARPEKLKKYVI